MQTATDHAQVGPGMLERSTNIRCADDATLYATSWQMLGLGTETRSNRFALERIRMQNHYDSSHRATDVRRGHEVERS